MKYEEFICYVKEKVQKQMGETVHIDLRRVTKNNGVEMDGLSITKEDRKISPMIYLEEFYKAYERGMSIPNIVGEILKMYEKAQISTPFDPDFYSDFEKVKDKIACKLINYEKNQDLLTKVPHMICMDLAIVFYYMVEDPEIGDGTILIYNSHLEMWEKQKHHICDIARKNTVALLPYEFQSMGELLEDALGDDYFPAENSVPMYVLSNVKKYLGAVAILYDSILSTIGERIADDFYILPSSVHEVIIVPADIRIDKRDLQSMVKEINETQVSPEEVLSDKVYYYERATHRLRL